MARNRVEQVKCDRCTRVELQPVAEGKTVADFEATFEGKKVVYQDICSYCKRTLQRLWEDLSQWKRDLHQSFGPALTNNEAPPTVSPTNFTPPKPHSK